MASIPRNPGFAAAVLLLVSCRPAGPTPVSPSDESTPSQGSSTSELTLPAAAIEAAAKIDAAAIERDVRTISSDDFRGRGPGTKGDATARAWLAEQLEAAGYQPGLPDGSWEQPFEIVGITAKVPERWVFSAQEEQLTLRWWDQFIAASGVQQQQVKVADAEVVFVGHGIVAPEEDWDDFKGTDLKGKVLLMLNDEPQGDDDLFGGQRRLYYGRWTYKYESAARQGAAGAIIIHTKPSAGYPWSVVQSSWNGEQVELPAGDEPRTSIHAWVTESSARELVELGGYDLDALIAAAGRRDFRPVPLGIATSLSMSCELRTTQTANVIGTKPGSDASVADETVVFSAHHDHLGEGKPNASGDRIYNGARDNGTGIALALAVARAFDRTPDVRRTVSFVFVGAEEQGLLGSKYYAEHPVIPAEQIAANINFELGNIWGPTKNIVIHGKGKSNLDDHVMVAAAHQGRRVEGEADPRSGWYYRSDQFSFARVGIPSLWVESGREYIGKPPQWGQQTVEAWISEHYHQPTDEVADHWRFDGMVDDAELAFLVGVSVANADAMPAWNPGDEFADIRVRSR